MTELKNKYLIFCLENEYYAIPISKVQEVIRYIPITKLHEASEFLKGVINLRGKIIPIIDMRLKFGMKEKEYTDRTVFVVVDIFGVKDNYHMGLAVDSVSDVVEIDEEKVEKTPEVGFKFNTRYLLGITQINEQMIMLLNLDNILSTEEIVELKENAENL